VSETGLSALDRASARRKRSQRHVWIEENFKLKAIEVQVGLSDSRFTEMVAGGLKLGQKLVIGIQPAQWGQ
jgi:HlyD family secretion protein